MPPEFIQYINHYGYLAIFVFVLLQEIGFPIPIPNELLMLFSGYLTYNGTLKLYFVLPTVIFADFLGGNILYTTFYFFGPYIIQHKPKWFPLSNKTIDKVSHKVANGGLWSVFLGRITPFIRGYISVIAGLLHLKPKNYLPITFLTACLVTSTYVIMGHFLGPYWSVVAAKLNTIKYVALAIVIIIISTFIIRYYLKRKAKRTTNTSEEI